MKVFLVPVAQFREQIKSLADSGYHTITPDEYYAYLTTGAPLPSKPVMITFDDTDEEQYTIGATELNKYGFKGVFFVMTISIGRPHYMSSEQIKDLSDHGHVIAAHTWDHHSMKDLHTDKDYSVQLTTSKQKLESIIGKHVDYFAYPFGVWDEKTIPQLKSRGYKAAFQLAQTKRDSLNPLYTIRRMLVPGSWNGAQMQKWMKVNFHS
jgi:peptidoglycan/xylan/chitin deacetylase (PgdA/CDA1 family)